MLDVNNYQIIIISYQLRGKGLLYGDILSNCLEGKISNGGDGGDGGDEVCDLGGFGGLAGPGEMRAEQLNH